MLRKTIIRLFIPLILVVLAFYLLIVPKTVSMVTDYTRYTFEYVTENPELLEHFHIGDSRDPSGFGFPDFQEIEYKSLYDDIGLSGWFVPSTNDGVQQTLIISHGRTSNRLKAVKYLQIIKDYGLDSLYHVFVPDLRNSGKSQEAKTAMGYEFAEDIAGTLKMLQDRFDQHQFVLWGFSMGAIGSATCVDRPDIKGFLEDSGLSVQKLILASPISNVERVLRVGGEQRSIPGWLFNITFKKFSKLSDGYVHQMKLSNLLKNDRPALVLYGTGDSQTPSNILEDELIGLTNVQAEKFEGADHVQIYTQPEFKDRYAEAINTFLRN